MIQVIVASQMVYEEKFITKYNVPALKAVGWEGTFGFMTLATLLIPFYFIPGNLFLLNLWRISYFRKFSISVRTNILNLQLAISSEILIHGTFWKMYTMDYINLHTTLNSLEHFHLQCFLLVCIFSQTSYLVSIMLFW